MKRACPTVFALFVGLAFVLPGATRGQTQSEPELIQILQSSASPREKDAACVKLKIVGTAACVPALAGLLADEQLSHSARYVLESMSSPVAGEALVRALSTTKRATKLGIIDSLGVRREASVVAALKSALRDEDKEVACGAAAALGRIGTKEALRILEPELKSATGADRVAVGDACITAADSLSKKGEQAEAARVFKALYASNLPDRIKTAAYRGWILASGDKGLELFNAGLVGPAGPGQTAALGLAHSLSIKGTTATLIGLLPKLAPPMQAAVIGALGQRGDPNANQAIIAQLSSTAQETRLSAINALGVLGQSSSTEPLARAAASSTGAEQAAARLALTVLKGDQVTAVLLSSLPSAEPGVQAELARALGERGDSSAVPKLLALARDNQGAVRNSSLQSLAALITQKDLEAMVRLAETAKDPNAGKAIAEALNTACQRLLTQNGRLDLSPLIKTLETGSAESQVTILSICGGFVDPQIRSALKAKVNSPQNNVRAAAAQALCDTVDPALLPELTQLAAAAQDPALRNSAVEGLVRLWSQDEPGKPALGERLASAKAVLKSNPNDDQLRRIFAGLAEMPHPDALSMLEPGLDRPSVRNEAGRAITRLAPALPDAQMSSNALAMVIGRPVDGPTREAAESALKQVKARAAYITTWQVAGPYRQAGKDYTALFDVPFPPENGQSDVKWETLAPSSDPARPFAMDLLKPLGGEQAVAYARAFVKCDSASPHEVVLDLGSDDGMKVWVNGKLVHQHNVARALTPGSDKAKATLQPGWNELLLKITQNNQGWEFCARVLEPDGSVPAGLKASLNR